MAFDNSKIYIQDNFYKDPDRIRYFALQQGLYNHGYHPGMRTLPCFNKEAHDKIVELVGSNIYPIGDCYSFQFNTENDVSWIHSDNHPSEIMKTNRRFCWAAVIYLTPDAPIVAGTTLYSDKKYGKRSVKQIMFDSSNSRSESEKMINELSNYGSDRSKWNSETIIGNKYNRIVIYDASYFHEANVYFGNTKENSRLIQIFFFYTKNNDNIIKPAIEYRTDEYVNWHNIPTIENTNGFLHRIRK
jgi:hypothetical protein